MSDLQVQGQAPSIPQGASSPQAPQNPQGTTTHILLVFVPEIGRIAMIDAVELCPAELAAGIPGVILGSGLNGCGCHQACNCHCND